MRVQNRWQVGLAVFLAVIVAEVARSFMPRAPVWLLLVLLLVFGSALAALVVYARRRRPDSPGHG